MLALIFMFSFSLAGADASINWESLVQTEIMETVLDSFRVYPFTLQVNVENLVFLEWMGGSDININFFATYTYLILLASSLSVILAVSTTLSRFWFLVANTLFIVVLIALKLDLVMLFESTNRLALVFALVAFLPTSYYFHAINKNFSLAFRIITFLTITGLLALTIHFFSGVERPFLHLAAYGMTVPLILSLLFIIMVAHDIMAAFLNALSSGSMGTTGNWKHFFIISFIYLANLLILYLNETHVIEWDVLPVNHFVLVAISAILGIWGFRQREPQYEYLASFQPGGAIFFLAMGTIFFSSTGYFMANGNDPVIEVFKDIIIYSHFAYGLIFLMYIAANFLSAFTKNLPIHRILYKPQTMPYFTYRLVGLITMAAFIFLQSWKVPVQYSFSGYFNNLGDLYKINGDPLMARGYYEEGSIYGQKNHHSNYGLAKIAEEENDVEKAINYYKNAIERRPTPYSLTNLSNIQYNQNMYFDALFTLQEGRKKFPDNGPVQNNLGLLYLQSGILDSSLFYLEQSENSGTSGNAAKNNIMVVLAKSEMKISTDSIIGIFEQDDAVFHAN
ncbi:MAG: hypothetical protein OEX02_10935, partial [Cyclobacteriaceae bacterium]|nr:hypothetical protein [Cyclobacteriaceae bacterium]